MDKIIIIKESGGIDPCRGCRWLSEPWFSIIPPCECCPRKNGGYINTVTTSSYTVNIQEPTLYINGTQENN